MSHPTCHTLPAPARLREEATRRAHALRRVAMNDAIDSIVAALATTGRHVLRLADRKSSAAHRQLEA